MEGFATDVGEVMVMKRGGAIGVMLGECKGYGGLPGIQDADLTSGGNGGFYHRYRPGCGDKERRGSWVYAE